ncbi:alpha/beta hydrolase [Paenibacillus cellulositrophicus]|uniref:alpha/beta hydrolase n=1 Tax=Paenibacillus cellulositrophicus TaxID=562959 RepID=UPI001AD78BF1|nr:alpha/beta hydrolase [Paenibacillus cellulositrophicus]
MREQTFTMTDPLGTQIHIYAWLPDEPAGVKAVLQITHGMCETAERYKRLAALLTRFRYAVYAHDQRGHGLTAGSVERLGHTGKDGFRHMLQDIQQLGGIVRDRHPDIPHFLMGHSMGSFLVQRVMETDGGPYTGFILSGTNGPRSMLNAGKAVARLQGALQGESHRSILLNAMVFGSYNRSFSPTRTRFDWLSRDPKEVDKYIEDPYCGAICTTSFFYDFFSLLQDIQNPGSYDGIPRDKPVYLFSGELDPVGERGKGVRRLEDIYRSIGIKDVECRLYPNGRHEMLNEMNRDEVMTELLDWLERHV